MIRINLLGSAEGRTADPDPAWRVWTIALGGPALGVAAVFLMAWWSWALRAEAAEVSRALAAAEATLGSLAPAVEDMRAAEAQRDALGGRVGLLEELHARRQAAVRLLDRLRRDLPDDLWFSELREEAGRVVVRGHAATLAAVSDYAAALEAAGGFGAPVEIADSQRDAGSGGRQIVSFELRMPVPAAAGEGR